MDSSTGISLVYALPEAHFVFPCAADGDQLLRAEQFVRVGPLTAPEVLGCAVREGLEPPRWTFAERIGFTPEQTPAYVRLHQVERIVDQQARQARSNAAVFGMIRTPNGISAWRRPIAMDCWLAPDAILSTGNLVLLFTPTAPPAARDQELGEHVRELSPKGD